MTASRRTHVVRFVEGPRDGQVMTVMALESGEPPEILLTPGRPEWVYLRAGAPKHDGSLPYLHMSPSRVNWIIRLQSRRTAMEAAS